MKIREKRVMDGHAKSKTANRNDGFVRNVDVITTLEGSSSKKHQCIITTQVMCLKLKIRIITRKLLAKWVIGTPQNK
jgi:hypothetical protein